MTVQFKDHGELSVDASQPPPKALKQPFFVGDWEVVRDSHVPPVHVSSFAGSEAYRGEVLAGCRMLGLRVVHPQQLLTADAVNAADAEGVPVSPFVGVLMPRRSSKTTTLIALLLGRCLEREDYLVGYTMCTTGQKARDRFLKDIVPALERAYPGERPFTIRKAAGSERVVFDNGSLFQVLTPSGEAFRSDAFDCILLDEAGEASPELAEDLLSGALPTLDTRVGAQVIIAGTAAKYRKGNLLWDTLEEGREGVSGTGIVEYSAPDGITVDDIETWEMTEPIVRAAHPGIGTLTTVDAIERNFRKLSRGQFLREYLSIFEDLGASTGIVRPDRWAACDLDAPLPVPPAHFVLGISVSSNQSAAAIVAAWREDGRARGLLLDHREGVRWLAPEVIRLARLYRVKVAHDSFGPVLAEVTALQAARVQRLVPFTTKSVTTAAALLVKEINDGNVGHYGQDKLTASVLVARKRKIGVSGWGFGRGSEDDDISAVEAFSMALLTFDESRARKPIPQMFAA